MYFDDDDDTQAVKEEQQRRHKQNINRLVRLAKQHQNGFETWLAGREPSNTKSITRSLNVTQTMRDVRLEGPIDVDSGEEWTDDWANPSGLTVGNVESLGGSIKRTLSP